MNTQLIVGTEIRNSEGVRSSGLLFCEEEVVNLSSIVIKFV